MKRAKALGIDAFALNIGLDPYTDQQLGYAYESAANNGMKVFISFDFNWYHTSDAVAVGRKIAQYAKLPAQLIVDNKVFASSFAGDGVDVAAIRSAALNGVNGGTGVQIFWAPNFHPEDGTDFSTIDGALNWMVRSGFDLGNHLVLIFGSQAWPNNGNNKAPTPGHNVTVAAGDSAYVNALGGKAYIARESEQGVLPYGGWY
jgi:hypothetical protein